VTVTVTYVTNLAVSHVFSWA